MEVLSHFQFVAFCVSGKDGVQSMAVRYRKYFQQCKGKRNNGDRYGKLIAKGISCEGKRSKNCPEGIPKDKPCGGWAIEFRDQQGKWQSIIKPGFTKTTAKEAYLEIIRNIQRGLFDLPILQKMPKVTVEAYARKYLEHIKGSIPENTFVSRQTAANAIIRRLGDFEVSRLNIVLIQRFCTDVLQLDQAKASTVNQYCSILRLVLDMAVQERVISTNPMQGFKRLKVDETTKRILTNEEIRAILDESILPMGSDRMAILIGMLTGIRLMDVIGLDWSNIDFNNFRITLIPQKTGRSITLPLSGYLLGELKRYKELMPDKEYRLFYDGELNLVAGRKFSRRFVNLFKRLGMNDISFHNLRHTNASKFTEVIQDVSVASKLLGHSHTDITMGYIHKDFNSQKEAIEKFTNHMLSLQGYEPEANQKIA
ncbi:MAG: Integrase [Candidatus Jettenia ecosi]|uniref:Integrase n=1 Tax=Candidatus Jettenia ecosi TaxID=2494326 RepID=A0A533QAX1_9BACT|nr:MAG: Integrase [Candidatus Jettenia ecosi]